MFYPLDILKPKTKTKNQNIFCWCKGDKNFFFKRGKKFSCPLFKVYNKVEMLLTKKIDFLVLVFDFS